ncbi:uncharacterized protein LOC126898649 [Daktulosphaira vitifoliae]|uniref:uncharacterized protein LOC126898649 n=1 Tax=Daktulosphaira vitifoliae TaxID=58002 RepID=UPI0021A9839B|nr:uncharacterized protein LOC126898649 [Daktulosphaira vitifoliae]
MAPKINLKKLAAVLKKYKCDPCFWKNIKIGDEVIYAAAKACLKNTSSISRQRIALILVEGRCNILNVYNGIQDQKTNFIDQICLKRSERTWVKQKQQMLGCMSPDISYYMINLGKKIKPPNENGKIEDQLMTNKIIMNKFDPNDYRKKLQNLILSKSECMKNSCLICGVDEGSFNEKSKKIDKRSGEMVQCESCTRWLHINCLPKKDPLPDNDIKWIFGHCSANVRQPNEHCYGYRFISLWLGDESRDLTSRRETKEILLPEGLTTILQ